MGTQGGLQEVSVNDGGINEDVPDVSIAELESMSRNDRHEQLRAECYLHANLGTHETAVLEARIFHVQSLLARSSTHTAVGESERASVSLGERTVDLVSCSM